MPHFLDKKKYVLYFILTLSIIISAIALMYFSISIFLYWQDVLPHRKPFGKPEDIELAPLLIRERAKLPGISMRVFRHFSSIVVIILLSIIYKLIMENVIRKRREVNLKNEYLETEMKFLKSQINPHFLFNALNNIYTLVRLKENKAPDMLMRLSNMLRYMLYECNEEFVPIEKEIQYVENYIELQQLKTEYKQNINVNLTISDNSLRVPPLLIIPFIENSFKHSGIEKGGENIVEIELNISKTIFYFKITNSIVDESFSKDKVGGIGLENVKRRLELLYGDSFSIDVKNTKQQYIVVLKINLQ